MKYKNLGITNQKVSLICLGTMTYGEQNTQKEAFEQMDYALDQGINFFDTAEMYPVPTKKSTYGATETIIGNWFQKRKNRKRIVLATKIVGKGIPYIRSGSKLTKQQIFLAIDASLKRLQTDYIDLYQLHWPTRTTNIFAKLGFHPDKNEAQTPDILESLTALSDLVKQGKIRYIGISNESPWGVSQFLNLSKKYNLAKIVSIQNPYSLLNRTFEVGLSEFSYRENINLLAYSPLAFGMLSGKYLQGQKPSNSRLTLYPEFKRYTTDAGIQMTEQYCKLAENFNLDPAQMALAFVNSRFFVDSNIIGATTMEQLKSNIATVNLKLSWEVLEQIELLHAKTSNPTP